MKFPIYGKNKKCSKPSSSIPNLSTFIRSRIPKLGLSARNRWPQVDLLNSDATWRHCWRPMVNIRTKRWNITMLLMGKSTISISMAHFLCRKLFVYQRKSGTISGVLGGWKYVGKPSETAGKSRTLQGGHLSEVCCFRKAYESLANSHINHEANSLLEFYISPT